MTGMIQMLHNAGSPGQMSPSGRSFGAGDEFSAPGAVTSPLRATLSFEENEESIAATAPRQSGAAVRLPRSR